MENEIKIAADALRQGKIILYPTDTIWGLGCDPTNPEAVKKIFKIKGRDERKALILLVSDIGQLQDYVVKVPDIAWDIVEYAEKPLTVIFPKGKNVAGEVLAEDGSIAIRVVKNDFCKSLIRRFGKGIVSTSANFSGKQSALTFKDIDPEIKRLSDHIVNFRQDDKQPGRQSMVMKIGLYGEVKILRK